MFLKRYWKVVNKPVFSPEGELVYILHAAEDITAEVKALKLQAHIKEIEESEQRFRLMADAIPEIIWVTDAQGNTEFMNKRWEEYSGSAYVHTTAPHIAASFVHPDVSSLG